MSWCSPAASGMGGVMVGGQGGPDGHCQASNNLVICTSVIRNLEYPNAVANVKSA